MIRSGVRLPFLFATLGLGPATPLLAQPATTPSLPAAALPEPTNSSSDESELPAYCEVRVSPYMTVDILVQNEEIVNVLQKLAVQSRRNILPNKDVKGRVSATIYGVAFYDALDALLGANGFGYIERGDFIHVLTAEQLSSVRKAEQQRVVRVFHLNYLTPDDAQRFVRTLLSSGGTVEAARDPGAASEPAEAGAVPTQPPSNYPSGFGPNQSSSSEGDDIYTPDVDKYSLHSALIIVDYPENLDQVAALLEELDTPPSQVLLEATVVQTTLNEANAFGIDFALLSEVQFTDFFGFPDSFNPIDFNSPDSDDGDPSTNDDNRGFVVSNPGNTGSGSATVRGGIVAGDVGVFIRALDQVTDVSLLSNPKVLTLNRQRARVLVGTRVGYLETAVVENQVLQTIKYIDTGIELDIRPFVLRDDMVRLELKPKVSDVTFRNVIGAGGQTQQIPDERIQTVVTDILLPAGYTAVLGGLFREDSTNSRNQVPILGDIPLIGAAFRGHDDQTNRSEIMFLVKSTIMNSAAVLDQADRALAYADRVRAGSRQGLLPWSRDRQSAQLNLDAERYAQIGDYDRALWAIRRSLELNPYQPEAIRIREQLMGAKDMWPTRSILSRVVNEELEEQIQLPPDALPPLEPDPAADVSPGVFPEDAPLEPQPADPEEAPRISDAPDPKEPRS